MLANRGFLSAFANSFVISILSSALAVAVAPSPPTGCRSSRPSCAAPRRNLSSVCGLRRRCCSSFRCIIWRPGSGR
ncbi:exported hypothetical protein [Mesorhizobium escarrei]|uniref:Secreted protein n=1 Tax=Mesorhizobium escarrei TaxID=666018 RepID=A0ABM9EJT0_9HYPH|nr:exported hypothetical protein [Mesorhizobium escarrei]